MRSAFREVSQKVSFSFGRAQKSATMAIYDDDDDEMPSSNDTFGFMGGG